MMTLQPDKRFKYGDQVIFMPPPAAYQILRERPRPLGRGCRARRTEFGFFVRGIVGQYFLHQIRQIAPVLFGQSPKPFFEFLVDFHVQNFVRHVDSGYG